MLALWRGVLSLLRLTSRWAVFVPAGMTLVDPLALVEPRLVRRGEVVRLGAAPSDTTALDLTAGATGLILQLDLNEELSVVPVAGRGAVATPVAVTVAARRAGPPGSTARRRPGAGVRHRHVRVVDTGAVTGAISHPPQSASMRGGSSARSAS